METYNTTTVDGKKLTIQVDKVEEQFLRVTYIRIYVDEVKVDETIIEKESKND
tara:strand:+ start:137 stop:295 length:159 start_codon:yes stop_codon:yes gene_type:complete